MIAFLDKEKIEQQNTSKKYHSFWVLLITFELRFLSDWISKGMYLRVDYRTISPVISTSSSLPLLNLDLTLNLAGWADLWAPGFPCFHPVLMAVCYYTWPCTNMLEGRNHSSHLCIKHAIHFAISSTQCCHLQHHFMKLRDNFGSWLPTRLIWQDQYEHWTSEYVLQPLMHLLHSRNWSSQNLGYCVIW